MRRVRAVRPGEVGARWGEVVRIHRRQAFGRASRRRASERFGRPALRGGHLMPGSEDEAVALVDGYLERSTGAETGASATHAAQLRGL